MGIYLTKTLIREIEFRNYLDDRSEEPQVELKTDIKHSIDCSEKMDSCIGKLSLHVVSSDNGKTFVLKVELHGLFDIEKEKDKHKVYNRTYEILAVHLQSHVVSLTTMAGLPPLYLPTPQFNE